MLTVSWAWPNIKSPDIPQVQKRCCVQSLTPCLAGQSIQPQVHTCGYSLITLCCTCSLLSNNDLHALISPVQVLLGNHGKMKSLFFFPKFNTLWRNLSHAPKENQFVRGKLASLLTLSCKTVGKHKFSTLGTNCFTRLKINCTLSPTGLSYKPGSWTGTPDWKLVL